jgi:hypothetical protein
MTPSARSIQASGPTNYASEDVEDVQYGYDRSSNRIWRHNTVAPDGGNDELYRYDGLQRLVDMSRGDLAEVDSVIDNATFGQLSGGLSVQRHCCFGSGMYVRRCNSEHSCKVAAGF